MKKKTKIILIGLTVFCFLVVKASNFNQKDLSPGIKHFLLQQDSLFHGSYKAKTKNTFMYSKPGNTFKTKIKLPTNVALSVTQKSGDFVYGKFNISSNRSHKGWFRLTELNEIRFTAPKITN